MKSRYLIISVLLCLWTIPSLAVSDGPGSCRTTSCSLFLKSDHVQLTEIVSEKAVMYKEVGHHGPAVENSHCAFRIYFNDSGAIDVYSKSGLRSELLEYLWYPTEQQQSEEGAGCDEYLVGKTVGIGGVALWDGEKEIKLVATAGRTARVGKTAVGAFAEMISYGVPYKGSKVDVSVRVDVYDCSRVAIVTARTLGGEKVRFFTGINHHPGESLDYGCGYISVWGVHPSDVSKKPIPLGAGMWFDPALFGEVVRTEDMLGIVSETSSSVSTMVVAASTKEAQLPDESRFFAFMRGGVL